MRTFVTSPPGTCVTFNTHSIPDRAEAGRSHARWMRAVICDCQLASAPLERAASCRNSWSRLRRKSASRSAAACWSAFCFSSARRFSSAFFFASAASRALRSASAFSWAFFACSSASRFSSSRFSWAAFSSASAASCCFSWSARFWSSSCCFAWASFSACSFCSCSRFASSSGVGCGGPSGSTCGCVSAAAAPVAAQRAAAGPAQVAAAAYRFRAPTSRPPRTLRSRAWARGGRSCTSTSYKRWPQRWLRAAARIIQSTPNDRSPGQRVRTLPSVTAMRGRLGQWIGDEPDFPGAGLLQDHHGSHDLAVRHGVVRLHEDR